MKNIRKSRSIFLSSSSSFFSSSSTHEALDSADDSHKHYRPGILSVPTLFPIDDVGDFWCGDQKKRFYKSWPSFAFAISSSGGVRRAKHMMKKKTGKERKKEEALALVKG